MFSLRSSKPGGRGIPHPHSIILRLVPCPVTPVPGQKWEYSSHIRGYPSTRQKVPQSQPEQDRIPPPTHTHTHTVQVMFGQVAPWTVCLLRFPAGGLSCFRNIYWKYFSIILRKKERKNCNTVNGGVPFSFVVY